MSPSPSTPPKSRRPVRPRHPARRALGILVAGLVVAGVFLLGLFVYVTPLPGSNCTDWYQYCPLGPGDAPLGTALHLGNGTGSCPAGNGSSPADCAYAFPIEIVPMGPSSAPVPSARDLSFSLSASGGGRVNSTYVVLLVDPAGARLGTWSSASDSWTGGTVPGVCGGSDCLSAPLQAGDALLLRALPNGGLPYSHQGDRLVATAVGDGFSGTVAAPVV
jgi:hypothetical protein